MADCLFCKVAAGEIPAKVVRRIADAGGFHDIDPKAPVQVLGIPARHGPAVRNAAGQEGEALLGRLLALSAEVASELGLDPHGYRIVTNTGPDAGQSAAHLHLHVMGGRRMGWPPG
jgi:histidine triad (HIT) family protein